GLLVVRDHLLGEGDVGLVVTGLSGGGAGGGAHVVAAVGVGAAAAGEYGAEGQDGERRPDQGLPGHQVSVLCELVRFRCRTSECVQGCTHWSCHSRRTQSVDSRSLVSRARGGPRPRWVTTGFRSR